MRDLMTIYRSEAIETCRKAGVIETNQKQAEALCVRGGFNVVPDDRWYDDASYAAYQADCGDDGYEEEGTTMTSTYYAAGDRVMYGTDLCEVVSIQFGGSLLLRSATGRWKGSARVCPTRVTRADHSAQTPTEWLTSDAMTEALAKIAAEEDTSLPTYEFAECDRIGSGMMARNGHTQTVRANSEREACRALSDMLEKSGLGDYKAASVQTAGNEWCVLPYGNECSETCWLLLMR